RAGGGAEARARRAGFVTSELAPAVAGAAIVAVLLPDEAVPGAWPQLAPALSAGTALVFAHGFVLLYADLPFPARADVVLVSPTGPGRVLRATRERNETLPAYLAVHRDGSGAAWTLARYYAARLGCAPPRRTTVRGE